TKLFLTHKKNDNYLELDALPFSSTFGSLGGGVGGLGSSSSGSRFDARWNTVAFIDCTNDFLVDRVDAYDGFTSGAETENCRRYGNTHNNIHIHSRAMK
ncbi:unnamed protein product, partial [Plutella xylostella]